MNNIVYTMWFYVQIEKKKKKQHNQLYIILFNFIHSLLFSQTLMFILYSLLTIILKCF